MDTVKSHLEILSEDLQKKVNYISWKFKLDLTLKTKGLFQVGTGIEMKPHGSDDAENVRAWNRKDIQAQALFGLNVSNNIANKIVNRTTSFQMLEKLELWYGQRSDLRTETLQRKFFNFKYDESNTTIENCITIQQCADEGEDIKENGIMNRILGTLPPKLHDFRTAWDNVPVPDKNLTRLFERLRLEDQRLNENLKSQVSDVKYALLTKQCKYINKQHTQGNIALKSTVECFKFGQKGHVKKFCRNKPCSKHSYYSKENYACNICNQRGHFTKDCPRKVSDSNARSEKSDSQEGHKRRALITVDLSTMNIKDICDNNNSKNVWYQDCAATQHMTSRMNWLENHNQLEYSTAIIIGDATKLSGNGMGDVKLEAYNSQSWCKIILKNVLYVPK